MASEQKFADYVCEQMRRAGRISARKMFGEYAVYCEGTVVALICDNQVFVRPTSAGEHLLGRTPDTAPFTGAKPHFRLDEELEDEEALARLVVATARELPAPKPKKKKSAAAATSKATPRKAPNRPPAKRKAGPRR